MNVKGNAEGETRKAEKFLSVSASLAYEARKRGRSRLSGKNMAPALRRSGSTDSLSYGGQTASFAKAWPPKNWSPYTPPDLCGIPSGVEGLGAYAPAQ